MFIAIILGVIFIALLFGASSKDKDKKNNSVWDEFDELEWSEDDDI